jgi:aminomethyltransferase
MQNLQELKHTSLYGNHQELGAKLVPFAGWEMPIQYAGILAEVRAVRTASGMFDVSHMARIYLAGPGVGAFLDWVLPAPVHEMDTNRAHYTLLIDESGGIIDDGIIYRLGLENFLLVTNASNRQSVLAWLTQWKNGFDQIEIDDRTESTAMIALQGPQARAITKKLSSKAFLEPRLFHCETNLISNISALFARTGYTGEDGFEFIVEAENAKHLWQALLKAKIVPCGLGARDLLRLEAGLLLHGTDMDVSTNPLEANLDRFVKLDKGDFCGSKALQSIKQKGVTRTIVAFALLERGIPRHGYNILIGESVVGQVTSGTYSPTLDRSIGLGYVASACATIGTHVTIDIRGRSVSAEVVKLPFYSRKVH